jgi:flagellin
VLAIQTNVASLEAQRNLGTSQAASLRSLARLSSGLRIHSARDDAAGLGIATRLSATAVSSKVALRGINDGVSLVQTAEGALGTIHELLQRGRELATQAANGSLTDADRSFITTEFAQLRDEIDHVARGTKIFGKTPLYEPTTYTTTTTQDVTVQPVTTTETTRTVANARIGTTSSLKVWFADGGSYTETTLDGSGSGTRMTGSGVAPVGIIPAGTQNLRVTLDDLGMDDDLQLFSRDGVHIAGSPAAGARKDFVWGAAGVNSIADVTNQLLTTGNGFQNGNGTPVSFSGAEPLLNTADTAGKTFVAQSSNPASYAFQGTYNGIGVHYSGDSDWFMSQPNANLSPGQIESLVLDNVTEPLFLSVVGSGSFTLSATWDAMPTSTGIAGGSPTTLATTTAVTNGTPTTTSTTTTVVADSPIAPPADSSVTTPGTASTATTVSGDVTTQTVSRTDTVTTTQYAASYVRNPPPTPFHIEVIASANVDDGVTTIGISGTPADADALGISVLDLGTADGARAALDAFDAAIGKVSEYRATYGALQNRLEVAQSNLSLQLMTTEVVRGRIRDVDVAAESSALSSSQVRAQAGIAVLAQSAKSPEMALSLLRG